MSDYPVIAVVRLTPRFAWRMAADTQMVLNVGRMRFNMPQCVRAVAVWWLCRKQFPIRMVAVPVQEKAE